MACWVATARDIGYAAHASGHPRCLNPYSPGLAAAKEWEAGWDKAEAQERETNRIVAERQGRGIRLGKDSTAEA